MMYLFLRFIFDINICHFETKNRYKALLLDWAEKTWDDGLLERMTLRFRMVEILQTIQLANAQEKTFIV